MDSQPLQLRSNEIQTCINDFKKDLAESENSYQKTLCVVTDNELRSALMEQHVVHTERQRAALAKMEALYNQVQDQLAGLDKSN